jgi:hypothetical protein
LNDRVTPLKGRCTGTFTAALKRWVRVPGNSLPPSVALWLAWEAITASGRTITVVT